MNIREVLDLINDEPRKIYSNGYNTIEYVEPYEVKITNKEGNSVNVLLANWKEFTLK